MGHALAHPHRPTHQPPVPRGRSRRTAADEVRRPPDPGWGEILRPAALEARQAPPFDKKTLVVLASTCDAWEARLPEETEVSAFVLNFFAWPDDIEIRLSDDKMHGAINRCFSVVALTRHTASAVWGGSEKNGFEQLADDIYACREVRAAPDIDALHSLTPQAQELR